MNILRKETNKKVIRLEVTQSLTIRDYLNLSTFLTFIEATSPQFVQIVKISGELEKWSISSLMGFTFAIDPPNSPCAKESLPQALQTNLLFSMLPPRYEIYVNFNIEIAAVSS
ncbi:hypothetical protein LSPCS325_11900 [Lysinibacillus sp. CTST325]